MVICFLTHWFLTCSQLVASWLVYPGSSRLRASAFGVRDDEVRPGTFRHVLDLEMSRLARVVGAEADALWYRLLGVADSLASANGGNYSVSAAEHHRKQCDWLGNPFLPALDHLVETFKF
jgi:hypothetical protein